MHISHIFIFSTAHSQHANYILYQKYEISKWLHAETALIMKYVANSVKYRDINGYLGPEFTTWLPGS